MNRQTLTQLTLVNGAILVKTAKECQVCIQQGEQPEIAHWSLTYESKVINLCTPHADKLIDLNEAQKGGWDIFNPVFGKK